MCARTGVGGQLDQHRVSHLRRQRRQQPCLQPCRPTYGSNTNHYLREHSQRFLLFCAGIAVKPHKWYVPTALWPPLSYKVTFVPHAVKGIQNVANAPHALVFMQDLIYTAGVIPFIQNVTYISEASACVTTCDVFHVPFYAVWQSLLHYNIIIILYIYYYNIITL
jgi:hypothetical protein